MPNRILASISLLCLLTSLTSGAMYLSPTVNVPLPYSCVTGCDMANPCGMQSAFSVEISDENCTVVLLLGDWSSVPLTITTKPTLPTPGTVTIQTNVQLQDLSLTYMSTVALPLIFYRFDVLQAQLVLTNTADITFDTSRVTLKGGVPAELSLQAPQLKFELMNTMWNHVSPTSITWKGTGSKVVLALTRGSVVNVDTRFFDGDLDQVTIDQATVTTSALCPTVVTNLTVKASTITLTGESFVFTEPPPTKKILPLVLEISTSNVSSIGETTFLRDANGTNLLSVSYSSFTNVALYPRTLFADIRYQLTIKFASFYNAPLWIFPNAPNAIISNNNFVATTPTPLVPLTIGSSVSLSRPELRGNTYNVTSGYCQLHLNFTEISSTSDESIDSLCASDHSKWLGNMSLATEIVVAPGWYDPATITFNNPASHLRLGQIRYGIPLDLSAGTASLTISNISLSVRPIIPSTARLLGLPGNLSVFWDHPEAGSYIIISGLGGAMAAPDAIQTAPNDWTASFYIDNTDLIMNVTVNCSICNSDNSTCTTPHTCVCTQGWTGPTCHSQIPPVGCGPSPGPGFTCVYGEWITNSPVEAPTVVIPGNTGTIVINGDLNVTNVITFSGLNSQLVVHGCVIINGSVEIQLTEQEIQQLATESGGKGSTTKNLISVVGNNTCPGATNFQSVPISLNSPQTCTKVTSSNASTKSSLSVLFTLDDGGCKKSRNIAAIVVPSVIGGIILLTATGILIGLYLKKKTANASKSRLSIGRA